jgi:hypothetical protein
LIDMDKDYAFLVNLMQEANEYAVYLLTEASYDGSALQALVVIKPTKCQMAPITEWMLQERIELLACANTHGKKFFAMGASRVCSDNFFKAQALLAREEKIAEKMKLKKSLQQKSELREKEMAILVEKAECFESNNYRNMSMKELDVLLNWYDIEMKATKKAEKVAQWREIHAASTDLPMVDVWTAEDKEELVKISNREIDMSETYLGRHAALQKRNAVAAVLDFVNKEWESIKVLREADGAERNQVAMANDIDDIIGALGTENEMTEGTINEGAV